jgi:threonine dehydrogenase-like Zn-dependent dehydrogenase
MIADGKLDLKPCISHRFSFERLPEALEFLANDRDSVTKIMIDMPGFEVAGATAT